MKFRRGFLALIAVPVLAIGLAACGGSSSNSSNGSSNAASSTPAATPVSNSGDTVSTKSISGVGTVLVDSTGMALYTNDQDTSSKIVCTGQCQSFWIPLKAPSGGQPTSSDSAVQSKLGVLQGQVTFNGKPIYTFVQDSPGKVTGNGFMDSFGGPTFTWTAATTGGAPASSTSTSSSSSSGGSAGGYGGSTGGSSSSGGSSGGYSY
jgi:predicted lipoprotein with Yx(FWY)xxD motif